MFGIHGARPHPTGNSPLHLSECHRLKAMSRGKFEVDLDRLRATANTLSTVAKTLEAGSMPSSVDAGSSTQELGSTLEALRTTCAKAATSTRKLADEMTSTVKHYEQSDRTAANTVRHSAGGK
ncbi:hypothetical protein AUCHE_05_03890 [Austwickia chelonae NBRC 105200]|uniref:Uncharacterized protein n=2 Tax=Austwickia TaxID=1184606 RepID=K6W6K8_9MICO|nr:hypothetical protein AUCHE_05_03890 [Austwickia chelonae NBRC 105200]